MKRKWLADNISDDLEPPHGASFAANKSPFSDEELNRMYVACDALGPAIPAGPGARPWGGEDARDFILLSVYTGLRISDVCLFDTAKRLSGNDVFLRMHKTQKELYTWIPDWLVVRLHAREAKRRCLYISRGQVDEHPHCYRAVATAFEEDIQAGGKF